jgi:hypothetical protein
MRTFLVAVLLICSANNTLLADLEVSYLRYGAVERVLPGWLAPIAVRGAIWVSISGAEPTTDAFQLTLSYRDPDGMQRSEVLTVPRWREWAFTPAIFWVGAEVDVTEILVVELAATKSKAFRYPREAGR